MTTQEKIEVEKEGERHIRSVNEYNKKIKKTENRKKEDKQ